MLDKYLKDNKLNYQKLYQEMQKITGFQAKVRREQLYQEVVQAYEEYKQTGLPTSVEKLESYAAEGTVGSSTHPHLFAQGHFTTEEEVISYLNEQSNRLWKTNIAAMMQKMMNIL